jgi:hypothetical protein
MSEINWEKHEQESDMLESEDILDTDIKINPDFYVHMTLIYGDRALGNPDINSGLISFVALINNLETYAKAAKMLDDDYHEEIEKFKTERDIKVFENRVQLAHLKKELILTRLFEQKTIITPMHLK